MKHVHWVRPGRGTGSYIKKEGATYKIQSPLSSEYF